MHLVLLETSGNQRYIFATNKLRENAGASELTLRTGSRFVTQALRDIGGPDLVPTNGRPAAQRLLDASVNRPIETPEVRAEVVMATSGKALVLVKRREDAVALISKVTEQCLREAPGVDMRGAISEPFEWGSKPIHEVLNQTHRRYAQLRGIIPGPEGRFQRLPIVEDCATSGLPAARTVRDAGGSIARPRSAVSIAKRLAAKPALERINAILGGDTNLASDLDALDSWGERLAWIAVVHADGNGLGQVFLEFDKHAQAAGATASRTYVDALRRFSLAVERCTAAAFRDAVAHVTRSDDRFAPVMPIVVGGDDVTVVCRGERAFSFTQKYLEAFEEHSKDDDLGSITQRAFGVKRLASCAGIAIVKPHYPFYSAYQLAEDLCSSAKRVKQAVRSAEGAVIPCSALDFHVNYDASGADLACIRRRLLVDGSSTILTSRPYVVTPVDNLRTASDTALSWIAGRSWKGLKAKVAAMRARTDDNERALPSTTLHDLRQALYLGSQEADRRLRLVLHRYRHLRPLSRPTEEGRSLFEPEVQMSDHGNARMRTAFLDALEAADFMSEVEP